MPLHGAVQVVFFRGQGHLTAAEHLRFSRRFGDVQGTHGEWKYEPGKETTGN